MPVIPIRYAQFNDVPVVRVCMLYYPVSRRLVIRRSEQGGTLVKYAQVGMFRITSFRTRGVVREGTRVGALSLASFWTRVEGVCNLESLRSG